MSEQFCDLHTHTAYSDGVFRPAKLIELAKEAGLACIAITDHDTVDGLPEARCRAEELSVELIAGIEISVEFQPGTFHLLGYFIDPHSKELAQQLSMLKEARQIRNVQIAERLQALGFKIEFEEVKALSQTGEIGRPHFAHLLRQKGYVHNEGEAFARFLAKGAPAYVNKRRLKSREAIDLVRSAGGISVLAHPKQLGLGYSELKEFVQRLKEEGLAGIEVCSSSHTKSESRAYRKIARALDLLQTGGSDFHGFRENEQIGLMGKNGYYSYEAVRQMKTWVEN